MKWVGVLAIITIALGCRQHPHRASSNDTVRFKIPHFSKANGYSMEVVELISVDELPYLKGWAADFYIIPQISNEKMVGYPPRLNVMKNTDGVYVALDEESLQIMTLYAHLEKILLFEQSIGVDREIGKQLWPIKIALNARFADPTNPSERERNGARYVGAFDAIFFSPYDRQDLNLALNGGVIAHEQFHSIFQNLYVQTVKTKMEKEPSEKFDDPNLTYNKMLMRAINEGLADVWGWLYIQDEDFVERSLGPSLKFRKLKAVEKQKLTRAEISKHLKKHNMGRPSLDYGNYPYILGNQIANRILTPLFNNKKIDRDELRKDLARAIIRSIPKMASDYLASEEGELISVESIFQYLNEHSSQLTWEYEVEK